MSDTRSCTCHPDEAPKPCQKRYALYECQAARIERLEAALREIEQTGKFAAQVPGPRNCLMEICETARAALEDRT